MMSQPDSISAKGDVEVEVHYGVKFREGVLGTRWNPTFGTGSPMYYTRDEAIAEAAKTPGAKAVRRTETTISVVTPWEEIA